MAEATASDPFAAAVGLLVVFSLAGVLAAGGYFLGKEDAADQGYATQEKTPVPVEQAFSIGCADISSNGDKTLDDESLKGLAASSFEIRRVFRRGENVGVEVELTNPVAIETEYSINFKSPAADSRTRLAPNVDSFIYDIVFSKRTRADL